MIIYKVTNKINNKVYIGQSTLSLEERKRYHYLDCNKTSDNTYFHNALRKYNKNDFTWEILEDDITSMDELNAKEIYYIALYNSTNKDVGYNLKSGGNNGGKNSIETKIKIGRKTKERWSNDDIASRMLEGLIKDTKTCKERAASVYKKLICKTCKKEFLYRPIDTKYHKPIFCCKECYLKDKKDNSGLKIANKINKQRFEELNDKIKTSVIEYILQNKDLFVDVKYNKLSYIFSELKRVTGLKDERSIMRPFGFKSRKLFVAELSKIYAEHIGNYVN